MEYSLWNMHGPTLWPSNSSPGRMFYAAVIGDPMGDVQGEIPIVTHEEITPPDIQVDINSEISAEEINAEMSVDIHGEMPETISSDMQVCSSQEGFIAMKPGSDSSEQVGILVNHESLSLDGGILTESDNIVLKVEPSPQTRIKVQRPLRSASSKHGHSMDVPDSILPPVDNLWNNGLVGANVNVKTESVVSYLDDTNKSLTSNGDQSTFSLMGRLPSKRLEPLSDESDVEDNDITHNRAESTNSSSSFHQQTFIPRLASNSSEKVGYECGECGFMADTRPGLKRHITVVHPAPAPDANLAHALMRKLYQSAGCPMNTCRFRAGDRNEMEAHVARHVSESITPTSKKKSVPANMQRVRYEREEYRCQVCSYSCTIEKAFYKHLKTHSLGSAAPAPTSKISCVICGKDRPSEADMNKHMRKHRDNRHFCCDICVFRTVQLKKLIQHRRMHTGEKPHLCPHCPYRSARRDNLRSHVRRVHKKDNLFCDTFSPRGLALGTSVSSSSLSQD